MPRTLRVRAPIGVATATDWRVIERPQLNEDAALLSVREGPTTNRSVVAIGRLFKAFAPAQGNALRSSGGGRFCCQTLRPDVSVRISAAAAASSFGRLR